MTSTIIQSVYTSLRKFCELLTIPYPWLGSLTCDQSYDVNRHGRLTVGTEILNWVYWTSLGHENIISKNRRTVKSETLQIHIPTLVYIYIMSTFLIPDYSSLFRNFIRCFWLYFYLTVDGTRYMVFGPLNYFRICVECSLSGTIVNIHHP